MRIDKEEKRSLKKLFVGILVVALLVTMMPFENGGHIITKAADIIVPTEEVYVVEVKSAEDETTASAEAIVTQALSEYALKPDGYSNGMVIKVYSDLDLSSVKVEGESSPDNIYFVISEDCNIYGCEQFFSNFKKESLNIYVLGAGAIHTLAKDVVGDWPINNWSLNSGMNITLSDTVDTSVVRFRIIPGASLTLEGTNTKIENPTNADKYFTYYYSEVEGIYKVDGETTYYIEEIGTEMIQDGVLDIDNFHGSISNGDSNKVIYTQSAIDAFPENAKLLYNKYTAGSYYNMPSEEFIIDNEYGIYSVSDNGKEMTVYALCGESYICDFNIDSGLIEIYGNFETTNDDGTSVMCTEVNFAEGAIRDNYTYYAESTEITESFHAVKIYQVSDNPLPVDRNFNFDLAGVENKTKETNSDSNEVDETNPDPFYIFNRTATGVTLENNGDISVYVSADDIKIEHVTASTLNMQWEVGGDSYYYAKTGDTLTLTPDEDYTIYDVQLGYGPGETFDYENGRRAPLENVKFGADGVVEVTVPNFAWSLNATAEPMEKISVSDVTITPECSLYDEESQTYWHGASFEISKENHDVVLNKIENGQNRYYVIDKTVEIDSQDIDRDGSTTDYVATRTYGKITYLDYKYVLDTATPTITSVTANTKEDVITLKDGWQASTVDTVWVNQPSVTLEATATAGDGLPIAGYKFGSAVWQTENAFTISGEGVHDIEIHARDEFDTKLENANKSARTEAGVWKASIGIDTTAPILLFTDANNSNLTELKSNGVYEGNLYFTFSESGSGLGNFIVYEKDGEEWISNSENLVSTADGIYIKPVAEDMTYRIEIADAAGNETVYENILVKASAQIPIPPVVEPPTVEPIPPTVEPEQPADKPVPPMEEPGVPEDKPVPPVAVGNGRVSLVSGTAYSLGEGTWKVSGDSTNYAGGITFYVSENGEYDFSQQ